MLKITVLDIPAVQRFVLEGKLTEPWLSEVKSSWEQARTTRESRRSVVDLMGVNAIDKGGEEVLLAMKREGALFVACGVSTKYRLQQLGIECQPRGVSAKGTAERCL